MTNRLSLCATITCLILAGAPAAASAADTAAARSGQHDFDFSLGSWTTEVTLVPDPFNKPGEVVHMKGTKVARPIWGGKGFLEEVEASGGGRHWQGANLFLYDPAANQWSQNFVDSEVGRLDGPPQIGGYRNGKLEFYWVAKVAGKAMMVRGTWTISTPDFHTYEVSRSDDGGRSWHPSFTARVTRAK